MIAADGPSAAQVDSFSLRTADGTILQFQIVRLELSDGGLPAAHLREHMISGEPITVFYRVQSDGTLLADRYTDAAETETQPPSSAPTLTEPPTAPPAAKPTPTHSAPPGPTASPVLPFHLGVEPFADGFAGLTFLANAGDGTGDLYAVEQRGVIWRVAGDGAVDRRPFLNIVDRVGSGGERGLLGLAFHPGFANNGRVFVDYTDHEGNTVVSEFGLAGNGDVDPGSEHRLLGIEQPYPNHNGGMLAFGSDGYLYVGTGDGGWGGDPQGNGQNLGTLLGKILRLDVDSGDPYAIPEGNPFPIGNRTGALPEIWDYGMRNPWRFSFDRQTGALWIGDVGEGGYEEVDAEPPGTGGRNYGWNTMEGTHCYASSECSMEGLALPVAEYSHFVGCSITGGYVYRGQAYPALAGQYLFSDYCSGNLWALDAAMALGSGSAQLTQYGTVSINPTAFGEDEAGELYLVNGSGQVFRLTLS